MEFRTLRPNPRNRGGTRPLSAITMIVVHCTEGSSAAGAAGWWARPSVAPGTEGSAHVVTDDEVVYRALDDDEVAYGARGYNWNGWHLEIAGFARWERDEWLEHMPRLQQAATMQAAAHKAFGVPFRESLTHGYHSHRGLPGNSHWDPGTGFPWDIYLGLVEAALTGPKETAIERLQGGDTLRLMLSVPGCKPYVSTAGWAQSLRPMQILAEEGIRKPAEREIVFTWRGGVWRAGGKWGGDPRSVLPVIRTVLNQHGP